MRRYLLWFPPGRDAQWVSISSASILSDMTKTMTTTTIAHSHHFILFPPNILPPRHLSLVFSLLGFLNGFKVVIIIIIVIVILYALMLSSKFISSVVTEMHAGLWGAEDLSNYDDASSSQSSFNLSYFSDREMNSSTLSSKIGEPQIFMGTTSSSSSKWTRFCPDQDDRSKYGTDDDDDDGRNLRMPRVRSLVDLRSQLLHRSLVEEINRRRLFKTVGAVENVGYHHYEPGGRGFFPRNASVRSDHDRRCAGNVSMQRT